ncbi:hypothetical protein QQF64_029258, partial [Cirrhinus molitorella]
TSSTFLALIWLNPCCGPALFGRTETSDWPRVKWEGCITQADALEKLLCPESTRDSLTFQHKDTVQLTAQSISCSRDLKHRQHVQ